MKTRAVFVLVSLNCAGSFIVELDSEPSEHLFVVPFERISENGCRTCVEINQ